MQQGYPKSLRLCKRYQFLRMSKSNQRFVGQCILIDARFNHSAKTCLGITVTKKYGKANVRNRFKRLVREVFRTSYSELKKGYDLNIKPLHEGKEISFNNIKSDLLSFLQSS